MDDSTVQDALRDLETALEEEHNRAVAAQNAFSDKLNNVLRVLSTCSEETEKQRNEFSALNGASRERLARLRRTLEEVLPSGEAAAGQQEALEQAEARAQSLEITVQEKATALEETEGKLQERESQLQEAKAAAESARAQAAAAAGAEERLTETQHELEEVRAAHNTLETELSELRAKAAADASRQEEAEASRRVIEEDLAALRNERDAYRQELQTLREEASQRLGPEAADQLRAERDTARQEADALRERVTLAEQRLEEEMAKGTKSTLAAQLADALKEAEELREQLRVAQSRLQQWDREGGPEAAAFSASEPPAHETPPGLQPEPEEVPATSVAEEERILRVAQALGPGKKPALGELLVKAGILDHEALEQAINIQKSRPQQHLGAILIEQGLASESAVAQGLACQCDVPFQSLQGDDVDPGAAELIHERLAHQHTCIPTRADENAVILAMANPLDLVAIEDVERATNRKVEPVVSTPTAIREAIEKYYWEPV